MIKTNNVSYYGESVFTKESQSIEFFVIFNTSAQDIFVFSILHSIYI